MPPLSSWPENFPSGYFLMMKASFLVSLGVFAMENERVIVSPSSVVTVMSTYWPAQNLIGESISISMPRMSWVSFSKRTMVPLKLLTAIALASSSSS